MEIVFTKLRLLIYIIWQQPDNWHVDVAIHCLAVVITHTIRDITDRTHRVTINNKICNNM